VSDDKGMTFDELTSIYRVESKTASISEVRKDLYPALSELSERIRREYETELSKDPGSIVCEGVNERRKKIDLYAHKTIDQRMDKICSLALGGAMGADNSVDHLTPEEREYYHSVLELSKKHRALIGRKNVTKGTVLNVGAASGEEPAIIKQTASVEPALAYTVRETVSGPDPGVSMPDIGGPAASENDRVREDSAEGPITEDIEECTVPDTNQENDAEECAGPDEDTEEHTGEEEKEEPVVIRILEDLPVFSGPDIDYDLKKEDVVKMPAVMAMALISREKAVRVEFKA